MSDLRIAAADGSDDIGHVRSLFVEYGQSLGFSLCFQGFDAELAALPGRYGPPDGALLLARAAGAVAGCVGLRSLGDGICEMKRLYVRPAFRRTGAGRRLAEAIVAEGRRLGYRSMRLDTLSSMVEANRLYGALGFVTIPSYYDNPLAGAVYYELALR